MKHQDIRTEIAKRLSSLLENPDALRVPLRDYQSESLTQVRDWLADPDGPQRSHIVHATGLGKSVLFASIVAVCTGMRSLIVVPTLALLEQVAREIVKWTGGIAGHLSSLKQVKNFDGEVVAVRGHAFQDVVIAAIPTFNRMSGELAETYKPDLIIYDECHRAYVEDCQAALAKFGESVIIGFSATPDYLGAGRKADSLRVKLDNGRVLYCPPDRTADTHFGPRLGTRSIRWGIENGWLSPLAWGRIEFDLDLSSVPIVETGDGLDFSQEGLQEAMTEHWSVLAETVRRLYTKGEYGLPSKQVVAICPGVAEAKKLAEVIRDLGVPSGCVTGDTRATERDFVLRSFARGDIRFLTSVMVLREGWNAPNAEVCLMLRPTASYVSYVQYLGRLLRLPEDERAKTALMLDAHFQHPRLCPLSAPVLFAEPESVVEDGGMLIGPGGNGGGIRLPKTAPDLPAQANPKVIITPALEMEETWADEEGVIKRGDKEYVSLVVLKQLTHISRATLPKLLEGVERIDGYGVDGHGSKFYLLTEAIEACDHLARYPSVDKAGVLSIAGIEYLSFGTAGTRLNVSPKTIQTRLAENDGVRSMKGRDLIGRVRDLYAYPDLIEICKDLLDKPTANSQGIIEIDGLSFATRNGLTKLLDLSDRFLKDRLTELATCRIIVGKDRQGKECTLYCVEDVRKMLFDTLSMPKADKEGIVRWQEEVCKTSRAHAQDLGISQRYLQDRLKSVTPMKFRDRMGNPRDFYKISDVKRVCADLGK